MMLLFSQIAPNWRADMESAPTIELLRLDWVGWQYAGGYGFVEFADKKSTPQLVCFFDAI